MLSVVKECMTCRIVFSCSCGTLQSSFLILDLSFTFIRVLKGSESSRLQHFVAGD
jgi:hypothetical protein